MDDLLKTMMEELINKQRKDLNGYWTFASCDEAKWIYNAYPTKEEAIIEANKLFPKNFVIGQLERESDVEYKIANLNFNKCKM